MVMAVVVVHYVPGALLILVAFALDFTLVDYFRFIQKCSVELKTVLRFTGNGWSVVILMQVFFQLTF